MSLNETPNANRCHISFFGMRNVGKSSVVNAITNQNMSIVSPVKGTTTDPVSKAMEILPLGPVVIFDTPGFDDTGNVGALRVEKTMRILKKTDIAVLVADATKGMTEREKNFAKQFEKFNIKYIVAYNKADLLENIPSCAENEIYVSAKTGYMTDKLCEKIANINVEKKEKPIVSDLIDNSNYAILVIPIDSSAPKGRLILPQVQTLRDLVENEIGALCVSPDKLERALCDLKDKAKLVICDSQVFDYISKITPLSVFLTSFSILMARYKGFLKDAVKGASAIDNLKDGSCVLIAESCTHKRNCADIGTVKLPKLLKKYTQKDLNIKFASGADFENETENAELVIHCGGCMTTEREMQWRLNFLKEKNIHFTNYGIAIAHMRGILERSIEVFGSRLD